MSAAKFDWTSAEVRDGRLSVGLEGDLSPAWKQSFEATVKLLGGGEWGEVEIKKQTVQVSDVPAGSEDKLRFFLESVVEQANATGAEEEEASEAKPESESVAAEQADPDAEMTERFRSFTEEDREQDPKEA